MRLIAFLAIISAGNRSGRYWSVCGHLLPLCRRNSSAVEWMDETMQGLWALQKDDGMVSGIYPDGNFSRTTIMYCLWKSKGVTIEAWAADIEFGAVENNNKLYLTVSASKNWNGKIDFLRIVYAILL